MSDPIGTVRREDHGPDGEGFSIWVRVDRTWIFDALSSVVAAVGPRWLCVHSTAPGNLGCYVTPEVFDGRDDAPVVGTIPMTPAATAVAS